METGSFEELSPRAPTGEYWWHVRITPGSRRKFGTEKRIAAYLWFNVDVGDRFSMRQLREALGEPNTPQGDEHLNRRLRALRPDGWIIPSYKDEPEEIAVSEYRLDAKGRKAWLGDRSPKDPITAKMRRAVLERDGHRCVICGLGAGEAYPGEPDSRVRLTIGHRLASSLKGAATLENLRAECSRCNEPVRDEIPLVPYESVAEQVLALSRNERRTLAEWLHQGERPRSEVDIVYERARMLLPAEQARLVIEISGMHGDIEERR